mmetsp:Transcript_10138/g.42064  ORF Transcript_10138/g.42064 Transcript_10138/m.42064 type:complete len:273 (-) Transcript_10138:225-1043(-)
MGRGHERPRAEQRGHRMAGALAGRESPELVAVHVVTPGIVQVVRVGRIGARGGVWKRVQTGRIREHLFDGEGSVAILVGVLHYRFHRAYSVVAIAGHDVSEQRPHLPRVNPIIAVGVDRMPQHLCVLIGLRVVPSVPGQALPHDFSLVHLPVLVPIDEAIAIRVVPLHFFELERVEHLLARCVLRVMKVCEFGQREQPILVRIGHSEAALHALQPVVPFRCLAKRHTESGRIVLFRPVRNEALVHAVQRVRQILLHRQQSILVLVLPMELAF